MTVIIYKIDNNYEYFWEVFIDNLKKKDINLKYKVNVQIIFIINLINQNKTKIYLNRWNTY